MEDRPGRYIIIIKVSDGGRGGGREEGGREEGGREGGGKMNKLNEGESQKTD